MKRRISRRTMRRRKIMSFLRKVQCGRGRFDRVLPNLNTIKGYAKPQTGRGRFDRMLRDVKYTKALAKPQTGRGIFSNMVGDYAWGQRMKYRI